MDKKSKIISLRLDEITLKELEKKASATNRSISDFIRKSIITTEVQINTKKDKALLIGSINRVGNNINQIAHNLNIAKQNNNLNNIDYETIINQLYIIELHLKELIKG